MWELKYGQIYIPFQKSDNIKKTSSERTVDYLLKEDLTKCHLTNIWQSLYRAAVPYQIIDLKFEVKPRLYYPNLIKWNSVIPDYLNVLLV